MTNALDPRIVQVGITLNGVEKRYDTIKIVARGIKFANANQNECEIQITNLDANTQNYILTECSPFNNNQTDKIVSLYAGRQSYGAALIYTGSIVSAKVSQPPDVTISLKSLTDNFQKGTIVAKVLGDLTTGKVDILDAARAIAEGISKNLIFEAENKTIHNYSFTGSNLKQVDYLGSLSNIDAYVDNDSLIVKQSNLPLSTSTKVINLDTGMVGIPDITERGLTVKFLLDNVTKVGGRLSVTSLLYPVVNGDYIIYKLGFEITNRDVPFYYVAEAKRIVG